MMVCLILAVIACALALFPAGLFFTNRSQYSAPPQENAKPESRQSISLLIPARDEEAEIGACVGAALASTGIDLEVIVLDDHSSDRTVAIVSEIARAEPRVRVETAPPLPEGWCGKQHACWVLAGLAKNEILAFIDADVRLEPQGLSRSAAFLHASGAALISGVPRQLTLTFMERLLIPLIHFVLLGFLPIRAMRQSASPAYGAGCGQFFMTFRDAYQRTGGHSAIRQSLHDGLTLPRSYRRAGLKTDLFDATAVAHCRMYRGAAQVWHGLAKNATEAMASKQAIVPWTVLLLGGQVVPYLLLLGLLVRGIHSRLMIAAVIMSSVAIAASLIVRTMAARRFAQSLGSALLHPIGITILVIIQWYALIQQAKGRAASWRGRTYGATPAKTD